MTTIEYMTVHVNGGPALRGTLKVEQDIQQIRSNLPRPNPRWEFTDANGHYHAYADDKGDRYPTLEAVTEQAPCDGSCGGVCQGEGYSVTRYFCRICREEIEPGALHGLHTVAIPGLVSWEVEVDGALRIGEKVSLRMERGAKPSLFGIAGVIGFRRKQPVGDVVVATTTLVGVSSLGQRPQ